MNQYLTRQTLLLRAKDKNDAHAWGDFLDTYKKFIYHLLHKMNVQTNDFDDVVQEVLIRLWEKISLYDHEKGRFRPWLSSVIRNLVLNYFDSKKRQQENKKGLSENMDNYAFLQTSSAPDIEHLIEREWKLHLSNMALNNIRPLFSESAIKVFEMILEGYEPDQICDKLNIKRSSIKVLKSRVKSRYIEEVNRLIQECESL
jgi:RNA polymerase sigma-70 factor (ECF subfamily)